MLLGEIEAQPGAIAVLENALRHGRLPQAYLFVGPSGVGKLSAAKALARAAICKQQPGVGCDSCDACRRIDSDKHPDVRVFHPREEGHKNLQVEFVREEVLPFAKFAPFEADAAFLIFPHADLSFPIHHAEAANAILKTLEEPPPAVRFVLTSERPERLLSTIRSRCQRVRFNRLPSKTLTSILERHDVPQAAQAPAVALCDGRADRALALAEEGRSEQLLRWALRVDHAVSGQSPGELLAVAEELARDPDRSLVLESLCLYYRDLAARALGLTDAQLSLPPELIAQQSAAARLSPAQLAARVSRVQQLEEELDRNANPELALDGLLFSLQQ